MIKFNNINQQAPFLTFKSKYEQAVNAGQKNIEAISISSFNTTKKEVDSRYVNLKFIENDNFIFFSNYESPKSIAFDSHNQIAALIYWASINVQIRMKARIKKTSNEFNQRYFFDRSNDKNALAISSNQSQPIESYCKVEEKFKKSLNNDNLKKCPNYWGGFLFKPYYFEFWEGHKSRINKREIFKKVDGDWIESILQP